MENSDATMWIWGFVLFIVSMLASVVYWIGRYYFNTDDEKAELKADSKPENPQSQSH